ncbi:MAG: PaaI family thioesterase [Gammaproteobacteria bacterium]|nr:MAG: PaaI family thioesterase [Gammaproteobacteria bacterium]
MNTYEQKVSGMLKAVLHCQEIGLELVSADKGHLTLRLPYNPALVGNPLTGVIHGGALTTLLDTACGFAAPLALDVPSVCPTLDLRIDYMRAAVPGEAIIGEAEVYRITGNVIFARGIAWQESRDKPVAHCVATFMRLEPHVIRRPGVETR